MNEQKRLMRSRTDRQWSGVSGGLAAYFGIDSTLVRLAFIVLALAGGPGFLLYIILWAVMPEESLIIRSPLDDKRKNDDLV